MTSRVRHLLRHNKLIVHAGVSFKKMKYVPSGVSFKKMKYVREVLQENAFRLVDKGHLLNLVSFIIKEEQACIRQEILIRQTRISYFDGTSHLGEVIVVVLCFIQY